MKCECENVTDSSEIVGISVVYFNRVILDDDDYSINIAIHNEKSALNTYTHRERKCNHEIRTNLAKITSIDI